MNYELHCKYFHSKLWHLKAHRKNPVRMVVLSNNDFHFNCRQQQMTKNKMDFYLTLEFFQRTNNSEEMDFNTKPELRVRTHLRSLFINLRPVWLQSDDSVEFVQGQVSILYVLAGWQESGGGEVWGGSRTITFTFTTTVTKGKRKKRPFDHISFVEGRQGEGCQVKSALIELHNDSLSLETVTVGQTEHSHCSGDKKNTWSQRELV